MKKFLFIISIIAVLSFSNLSYAKYSGGEGTPENPYRIANPGDLLLLAADTNDFNDCFILVNDINLEGYSFDKPVIGNAINFFQSGCFKGVFDGDGHKISNLLIDTGGVCELSLGLFGLVGKEGIIKNLGLIDVNITDTDYYYKGTGGLCGTSYGTILNCYSTGTVRGYWIGGLCGENFGNIIDCYSKCEISGDNGTGGLCGQNSYGHITRCYAKGKVSGYDGSGGLCGKNFNGDISQSFSTGDVSGDSGVGGLVGSNYGSCSIINSYSRGNVTLAGSVDGDEFRFGGLCGVNSGIVYNSYSTGSVSGYGSTGGLCGAGGYSSSFINSYFLNTTGPDNGLGQPLSAEQMNQQENFTGWDFAGESINGPNDIWIIYDNVDYPIFTWQSTIAVPDITNMTVAEANIVILNANLVIGTIFTEYNDTISSGRIVSQSPAAGKFTIDGLPVNLVISMGRKYSGGTGTADDPYQIANVNELLNMAADVNNYDKAFIVINDINLAGYVFNSAVIAPTGNQTTTTFTGIFDGNKHIIANLTIDSGDSYNEFNGFFGSIAPGSVIKNLILKDVNVIAGNSYSVAGLCGHNGGSIIDCNSNGKVSGNCELGILCGFNEGNISDCCSAGIVNGNYTIGGLCGVNTGEINGCRSVANVNGTAYDSQNIGGLCGYSEGNINNCYTSGEIRGIFGVGGICGGNNYGNITDCSSSGNVDGNEIVGGLSGINYGIIKDSYSTGNVTGIDFVIGGLCGYSSGSIEGCYSLGNVYGFTASYVGGLCGENDRGIIFDCHSKMIVNGKESTGGLCGINVGYIEECYSVCDVNGESVVGGLCGENLKEIYNSYANCDVNGFEDIGGICGDNRGSISGCYSNGNVIGFLDAGGFCGINEKINEMTGDIVNSYSLSFVMGDYCGGGFCGGNKGSINNCYSAGDIDGLGGMAGFCGYNYKGSISNCYFKETTGPDNGYGGPLTELQMKEQTSFDGWDFSYTNDNEAVWFMAKDGYPILTWQISPADIHIDGQNNLKDFTVFARNWMRDNCRNYNNHCQWADMNFDGYVDIDDLSILLSYWLEEGIY
jgi:hypothetical protein